MGPTDRVCLHETSEQHYHLIAVAGELDLATAPALRSRLLDLTAGGEVRLVLDFERVTFLDAHTIGILVATLARVQERGGWLRLVRLRPRHRRLVSILDLGALLPDFASVAQAVEGMARPAQPSHAAPPLRSGTDSRDWIREVL